MAALSNESKPTNDGTEATTEEKANCIPLSIVTGFLGSGKTTLINSILKHLVLEKKKVAIIQNEFATGGVEEDFRDTANAVLTDSDGSAFTSVVELANGCVCCTVKDNFTIAVEQLASSNKYDYILLECSGMADPGPLIGMFWIDTDLESAIYLDCVITVIDAKYFLSHIKINTNKNENENKNDNADKKNSKYILDAQFDKKDAKTMQIVHQIAYSDKILINKKDLIKDVSNLNKIKEIISSINQIDEKSIYITEKSQVENMKDILYVKAFDTSRNLKLVMKAKEDKECKDGNHDNDEHEHKHTHDNDHDHECVHDSDINNLSFENNGKCVNLSQCEEWLADLLWEDDDGDNDKDKSVKNEASNQMQIYRMKGVLPHKDGFNYYLQSVQELFEIEKGLSKWDKTQICRIIVIGKNLNKQTLQKGFDTIFENDKM